MLFVQLRAMDEVIQEEIVNARIETGSSNKAMGDNSH